MAEPDDAPDERARGALADLLGHDAPRLDEAGCKQQPSVPLVLQEELFARRVRPTEKRSSAVPGAGRAL